MDLRLVAMIATAHLRLRQAVIELYPHLVDEQFDHLERHNMATPNLQSLTKAMDMLEHDLETDAGALLTKVQAVRTRGKTAIGKGHVRIDGVAGRVADVEKFVTALEGSNGGDPLDSSSTSSEVQGQPATPGVATADPAAAPSPAPGATADPATAEQLTVNGVSKA
jgi:hypothetical protein